MLIDRSEAQKLARVDQLREELKAIGYSVVSTRWLVALQIQAKRILETETKDEETNHPHSHQGQGRSAESIGAEIA